MTSFAAREIRRILTDTWDRQGWQVPDTVTDYATRILTERIDKPDWQPEPSYAERYMQLRSPQECLAFGDTCWFTRAVFPDCMNRRGISSSYFVELGQGCYAQVLRTYSIPAVQMLKEHFEWTAEMTYTAIHSNGEFRSMWD
jgi:hypothetical protein